MVAVPESAAEPLGLVDHLVLVPAAAGGDEVSIAAVMIDAATAMEARPCAWASWLRFKGRAKERPSLDALLDLGRVEQEGFNRQQLHI